LHFWWSHIKSVQTQFTCYIVVVSFYDGHTLKVIQLSPGLASVIMDNG